MELCRNLIKVLGFINSIRYPRAEWMNEANQNLCCFDGHIRSFEQINQFRKGNEANQNLCNDDGHKGLWANLLRKRRGMKPIFPVGWCGVAPSYLLIASMEREREEKEIIWIRTNQTIHRTPKGALDWLSYTQGALYRVVALRTLLSSSNRST